MKYSDRIQARFASSCQELCRGNGLKENDAENRKTVCTIHFFHALFTTTAARDCAVGGILEIPYFWHYITPNPRHEITHLPDGKKLGRTKPPPGFERYKSYADADRLPSLYLSDLVTDRPKFHSAWCGDFFTFGWCSEREMAFNALMILQGFACKIKQEGIHVWSEVRVSLRRGNGKIVALIALVDNTFDTIEWQPLKQSEAGWQTDFGRGSDVRWYNTTSHSQAQLQAVKSILVSDVAAARIDAQTGKWLQTKTR